VPRRPIATIALAVVLAAAPGHAAGAPAAREGAAHSVPLYGALVRAWDAPEDRPFAAGHRGVDVAASVGTPVRASAPGTVSFAGDVAGNRTVTVEHAGGVRTSYSFLGTTDVHRGDVLAAGDIVGTVGAGHPEDALPPHVHLSARRSDVYFDPVELYVGTSYSDLVELVA
jgi:murein DD-endopeptidase MepM/ murein hydrolase activator NlpD